MKKILIIDDEINNCLLMEDVLEDIEEEIEIIIAQSGDEGLKRIKKEKPDLVLLDYMLPEISGTQICNIVKNEWKMNNIKIILITAFDNINNIELNLIDDFISKPYKSLKLLEKIKKLI